jgi:Leucine-rich repeat (LRR) protein
MAAETNVDKLDLHWTDEDPDLGIASEGVFCSNMDEITNHIAKVKDTVKKINLYNQHSLIQIPAILKECHLVEEINVSHTDIKEIPDFLFTLPALRSLSCCCSELISFPKSILKAQQLEFLHIRINKGWTIPNEITSLNKLKVLSIDLYSNAALPEKLGELTNLEELSIAIKYDEGAVPLLPNSFKNHAALKIISVNDPFYRSRKTFALEPAIKILSSCTKLESLKLSGFAVGKEHQAFSSLSGLKVLELRHLLTDGNIFISIAGLKKLEILNIWGSDFKITEMPDIFNNMNELREFSFAGNMILSLPPSIYNLTNLTTLEIGSTGISELDDKIGNLKNLKKIYIYDCILDKLPDAIFSLPCLEILNIEENIITSGVIATIKEKLNTLAKNGQKIDFIYDGQGHRLMVKRLRTLKNIEGMDITVYAKHCFNAVNENPHALKYINIKKFHDSRYYAELCIAAVKKSCFILENIEPTVMDKSTYFRICMEAARSPDIAGAFKMIRSKLLADNEYVQICIEAALHNNSRDFLSNFNSEEFQSRFNREVYEHICWAAVIHYPPVISKMTNPTSELREIAEKYNNKKSA